MWKFPWRLATVCQVLPVRCLTLSRFFNFPRVKNLKESSLLVLLKLSLYPFYKWEIAFFFFFSSISAVDSLLVCHPPWCTLQTCLLWFSRHNTCTWSQPSAWASPGCCGSGTSHTVPELHSSCFHPHTHLSQCLVALAWDPRREECLHS